ncbi:TetR family transcriptional regulator [Streptomyces sp. NPDC093990]|uniref:TetR family transcriptional regulator n=1 Tax=Streptomyces sp. NPDC093990 TaxID=3155306 RepID=UPI0034301278
MAGQGLRERKQQRQRAAIVEVGMRLFTEKGFDATTVEEIADTAEVSRRTLFRYFGTKGDIVMDWARGTTETLCSALRARPLDESPMESLRAAFQALNRSFTGDVSAIHAQALMVERTTSLRPYSMLKHAQWEEALAAALAERDRRLDTATSALLARIGVAAFRVALDEWLNGDGSDLPIELTDRAFDLVRETTRK